MQAISRFVWGGSRILIGAPLASQSHCSERGDIGFVPPAGGFHTSAGFSMGGALSRASPRVDALDVDAAVLHRFDAGAISTSLRAAASGSAKGRGSTHFMRLLAPPYAPCRRVARSSNIDLRTETEWPFGPLFRLLILTGARREEIGALRWSEIKKDRIELDGSRTKNGQPHTIPLSILAAALIKKLPRLGKSEYVFTTTGETPVSGWSKAKASLDEAVTNINRGKTLPGWRLHDLRRTVATGMQRLGISLQVIEAVLGHLSGSRAGIVGVYQRHKFDAEKKAAIGAWAEHVSRLVAENKRNSRARHG